MSIYQKFNTVDVSIQTINNKIANLESGTISVSNASFTYLTASNFSASTGVANLTRLTASSGLFTYLTASNFSASTGVANLTRLTASNFNGTDIFITRLTASNISCSNILGLASSGLTNFSENKNTSSPNTTVPVISLTVSDSETNIDAVFAAKGTGATLAQIPNGASSGGDKRGTYATDWQKFRSSTNQVAAGDYSTIGGGYSNRAVGNDSVIAGGQNNWTNAADSTIGGGGGNITNAVYTTVAGGSNNNASAMYASIGGGVSNAGNGQYSTIPGGRNADCRNLYGRFSYSSGYFVGGGDAQMGMSVVRRQTTNNTANVVLTSDGGSPTTSNTLALPNNSSAAVRVQVVARQIAGTSGSVGDTAIWDAVVCGVKRGANAASTTLVGTVGGGGVSTYADAGAAAWTVTLAANTTNGTIEVQVTGENSKTINWVATVYTTEVVSF